MIIYSHTIIEKSHFKILFYHENNCKVGCYKNVTRVDIKSAVKSDLYLLMSFPHPQTRIEPLEEKYTGKSRNVLHQSLLLATS